MTSNHRRPVLWTKTDFEVRPSTIPEAGLGLFARVAVEPNDTIGPYTGQILTDSQANRPPYVTSRYLVWVCRDCWIMGEGPLANYTRFINHSQEANAELVTSTRWKKARVVAIRSIPPGQEIFFDYGESYWECLAALKRDGLLK